MTEVAGDWTGQGSGEEVRFRHRYGLLTLTVEHETEFFFHVDDDGQVQGEGTIRYDMTTNARGLDTLVDTVRKSLQIVAPTMPKVPKALRDRAPIAGEIAKRESDKLLDIPGVTNLQYEPPKMKHGTELRHFEFRGQVVVDEAGEPVSLELEKTGVYRRPGRKKQDLDEFGESDDQHLVVTWEVNRVREESSFPCWSPFLDAGAELRSGPGPMWIAEFIESGEHRDGKSMWHEYGYVWMARRLTAE
jgi:hypothetical protein